MTDHTIKLTLPQTAEPEGDLWPPTTEEFVMVRHLDPDTYAIAKPPIFAEYVHLNDIVYAPSKGDPALPTFERVLQSSGYRTVRVKIADADDAVRDAKVLLPILEELGCITTHDMRWHLTAIAVPPGAKDAASLILASEMHAVWECNAFDKRDLRKLWTQ